MPIIRNPTVVNDIDYLILESTYGGRIHKSFQGMTDELRQLIEIGKKKKSKIIIPAFAVERTQLLVTMLKDLYEDGTLKNVPVYVDSPLAKNVTDVFRDHPECFDKETYKIFVDGDPFNFPNLKYIKSSEDSKNLNKQHGPMIIMSASGMCEGGRVTHHLIHSIEQEKNMIVITGFQARGTLGRKILDGADKVWIFNDEYKVRARVYFISGLSAHADGQDLKEYAEQCNSGRLKKIFLVHGDIAEARALRKNLLDSQDIDVSIPQTLTRVNI